MGEKGEKWPQKNLLVNQRSKAAWKWKGMDGWEEVLKIHCCDLQGVGRTE